MEKMKSMPPPYRATYDAFGDVMYLSNGEPISAYTQEDNDGLVWRYAFDTDKLVGLTLEDFSRVWDHKPSSLAVRLKGKLALSQSAALRMAKGLLSEARKQQDQLY